MNTQRVPAGRRRVILILLSAFALIATQASCADSDASPENTQSESESAVTSGSDVQVPVVAPPCRGEGCFCTGKTVSVLVNGSGPDGPISGPIFEVREEFEAATGATLEIVETPVSEHFLKLMSDVAGGVGALDASIAGAWWVGDLAEGDYILPLDAYYNDTSGRFPKWEIDDVLEGPRKLLTYGGALYMVANDHDGQVMYYRRDLLEDPAHQSAFLQAYGYALKVPDTWDEFRDVAEYFDGKDLNSDGAPDDGLTLPLKVGEQAMFHFMSFAAPFVIGPENPNLFWFDPNTMEPLLASEGHERALETLIDLLQFGPEAMRVWSLGEAWDHFLSGQAALMFTWGDLGSLAQEVGSQVKGKTGVAPLPGTQEYFDIGSGEWVQADGVNKVGNTTGGSWAGVVSRLSDAPDCAYFLLALLATKEKSFIYAARGWDGVDPGRMSHILEPKGAATIDAYLQAGWNEADVIDYTNAYYETFSNPLQFPYLRIPGTYDYWTSLDAHLFAAATDQETPEEALAAIVEEYDAITDRLGRDQQADSYRASLAFE